MKTRRITKSQLYATLGLITALALVILDKGCVQQSNFSSPTAGIEAHVFVTRSGSQLLLNGQPFRFAGANMHWLALDDSTNYPSQFRVNDGLDAAKEMGLTVIRSHDWVFLQDVKTASNHLLECLMKRHLHTLIMLSRQPGTVASV